jgi:hypothetical protein
LPRRVSRRGVRFRRIAFAEEALAKRFPQVLVDTDRRIIDHGDIISAGGFLSWIDLGLLLIERILGEPVGVETARFVLSDRAASEARYLSGFAPPQTHGDKAVENRSALCLSNSSVRSSRTSRPDRGHHKATIPGGTGETIFGDVPVVARSDWSAERLGSRGRLPIVGSPRYRSCEELLATPSPRSPPGFSLQTACSQKSADNGRRAGE